MQEITCNIQPFVCNPSFHVITYSKEGPWLCKPFFTPLKLRGVHNRLSWKQQETDHQTLVAGRGSSCPFAIVLSR